MKMMIHGRKYSKKPTDIPILKNQTSSPENLSDLTVEELANELLQGRTVIPCEMEGGSSSENWRSQQVFMYDIDNKEEPFVTVDETLELCSKAGVTPAFIYETFSSSPERLKMRVVFVGSRVVSDQTERQKIFNYFAGVLSIQGRTLVDTQCQDAGRLFFGTDKALLFKSFDARFEVNNALKHSDDVALRLVKISHAGNKNKKRLSYVSSKSLDAIKSRDVTALKAILNREQVTVYSARELRERIVREDMTEILGLPERNHSCIFHADSNPSASIFVMYGGEYYYKCFSANCGFRGNIIAVVEALQHVSRNEAILFLKEALNIKVEDAWVQSKKAELDENVTIIQSEEFFQLAPITYRIIRRERRILLTMHAIASDHIMGDNYVDAEGNPVFFVSNGFLKEMESRSRTTINTSLAELAYLKLIRKIPDNEIPERLRIKAEIERAKNLNDKPIDIIQFYSIRPLGFLALKESEYWASRWVVNRMTKTGMSKELIERNDGKEKAEEVYPKRINKEIPEESSIFQEKFNRILQRLISKKGFAAEREILSRIRGSRKRKETMSKRIRIDSARQLGLEFRRATREDKARFGIKPRSNPLIFVPKSIATSITQDEMFSDNNVVLQKEAA